MPKRRDYGSGSISDKRRKDGRLVGSFYYMERGKRRRKYVYGDTKVEVRAKLKAAQRAYEDGKLTQEKRSQSLDGWLAFWMETQEATGDLRPSTLHTYRRAIALYILPVLGDIPLADLDPETVQDWINDLAERYKPRTVRKIYGCLSSALQSAVRLKKIPFNPCRGVTNPRIKKYKGPVVNAQQARFLAAEAAKNSALKCMLIVAVATGMRKGELRALKWNEVDIGKGIIWVKRNLAYLPDETGRYRFLEGDPKSDAGIRPIALPTFAIEELRIHRAKQNEQRLARGAQWQDRNLVFTTRDGNYYNEGSLQGQFKRLLEASGLPTTMRFHDLRHSHATILFAMKTNPKIVQKRMGHAEMQTTLDLYGQVTPEMEEGAMEDLDAAYRSDLG